MDFLDYLSKAAQAAAVLHERDKAQGTPQHTPPSGIPDGPDVLHIYLVEEPVAEPEASGPVVESTIQTSEPQADPDTGEHETAVPDAPPAPARSLHKRWIIGVGLGVCLVLALVNLVLYGPLLFGGAPVTVTLIPTQQAISTTISVPLSTNAAAHGTLAGRMLSTLSLTQAKTVPTTGVGHAPAEPGRGHVTFYNAVPSVQTIPAGTLLTGKDGVEVVTDADAVIPGAAYPAFGQATVAAHTAITGSAGNVAAQDIYGPCCRLNISAVNSAFTGGQNAHSYPMVTYQDVAKAETSLRASLMQSVRAAFQAELLPSESLITPVPCKEQVDASTGLYAEATSLTIDLTETCADVAYDSNALTSLVTSQLSRQAAHTLGAGYALVGNVAIRLVKVTPELNKPSMLLLTVKGIGTWTYQFSEADLQQMAGMIAGKSASQATAILLHQPGSVRSSLYQARPCLTARTGFTSWSWNKACKESTRARLETLPSALRGYYVTL